jgi:hypothetical protein
VNFTQEELRSLPRVCLAQKVINEQLQSPLVSEVERREWALRLGEKDYSSYHHYCWALLHIRRGSTASAPNEKTYNYKAAIDNFNYVLRRASIQFPLLPEVNLRKGLTLQLTGDNPGAAREFMAAVKLKRDYTPAYAALVDIHLDLGNVEAAAAVLKEGLTHAPNSKILAQKRLEIEARTTGSR